MANQQWRAVGFGVTVHVARFGVIMLTLAVAPLFGVSGWYLGLVANVACVVFAAVLVTVRGLWRTSGILVAWRGPLAMLLLLPLVAEVLMWTVPAGLVEQEPGFGMWALTLLLVGINEELTSRVVVLERMRGAFGPTAAVAITAALFGLQHLSAFATTSRTIDDVLLNVLVSACYGFALAAFQFRFRWLWPLILLHAGADFTTVLTGQPHSDPVIAVSLVVFIALGVVILRPVVAARRDSTGLSR
ncbi:CPBP family intramembrane glutamic endopeptidase [Glaciibacter superstes]|uniref:CPBP family intramembrane glutamic endopeptidase n=1 Tax=Glaciibacter superstes TaxID=501023 RepID=UPI0012FA26EF|nr:CPBP family intramembrane glutamic endopeptidase [Glaciibacter superstes]